jgi:putative CocE/NonD family hydrolase
MQIVDDRTRARGLQAMVRMRDGARLNTFVFLPGTGGPRWPVILHRTPYGIAASDAHDKTDFTKAWLPSAAEPLRGSILRGWRNIVAHGYGAVYQDTRGRHGSEGEDRVYADDAADGRDTLDWIAGQPWSNQMVGMSGSSAGATTTFAAASTRHPTLRAFFAQAGASSIYDDVVYEGQSIEMERLWLWVARNIPGLSSSHRDAVMRRFGVSSAELDAAASSAVERYARLDAARQTDLPFIGSPDWMRLPLTNYPDFATWQPFLDEIITHPSPDAFRAAHNFRRSIEIPGFHVTSWFDIFQTSVLAAFSDIQSRIGNQKLWIQRALFCLPPQFLAARPLLRVVRLLAEKRAVRDHGRAGGILLSARMGRGPGRVYSKRLALCGTLAAAGGKAAAALYARRRQSRRRVHRRTVAQLSL